MEQNESFNALTLTHSFLKARVPAGGFCIDATAGRGNDTSFLCSLVGDAGRVLAFDIQQEAVDSTKALLAKRGQKAEVLLESHANMGRYAGAETVDCITFNFGWLPGGSHKIFTSPETSIAAVKTGLDLLRPRGVMTLCIYYGRDTGFAERDALLRFLPTIDSKTATVLVHDFCNRPNCPPMPVFILKGI